MSLRWHGRGRLSGRFPLFYPMKVNVYIDGFNPYYAAVGRTPYKWLDLRLLCEQCLPGHDIHRVKYFTARLKARPHDPDQPERQQAYLSALSATGVSIHFGKFRQRTKSGVVVPGYPGTGQRVKVLASEEKGSDVNLATELLIDGFRGDYEAAIVMSDDSDLLAPIRAVRQIPKLPVGILNPFPEFNPTSGKRRMRTDLLLAATAGDQSTAWFTGISTIAFSLLACSPIPLSTGTAGRFSSRNPGNRNESVFSPRHP